MSRRRSSTAGVPLPCRLGSTSSAIKTEARNTPWLNDFTVECTIGRGKFAVVKKCVEKSTGKRFAAKCIRRRRHNRDCTPDVLHEVAVLEMSAMNPYLVSLHRVYETSSEIVLILEYAAGGEIFDHCVGVKDTFTEANVRRLMSQILDGVRFLHDNDIVHLDLKPQNILLTTDGTSQEANIRLVDFGLSRHIGNGLEVREIVGTPDYVAPEVLSYEPITTAADMWSLGVVTYVMLTGVSPFLGDTKQDTLLNVTTSDLDFPADLFCNFSSACRDFIEKMLQREPCDRFNAKQSSAHPWITGECSPQSSQTRFNGYDGEPDGEVFEKDKVVNLESDAAVKSTHDVSLPSPFQFITVDERTDLDLELPHKDSASEVLQANGEKGKDKKRMKHSETILHTYDVIPVFNRDVTAGIDTDFNGNIVDRSDRGGGIAASLRRTSESPNFGPRQDGHWCETTLSTDTREGSPKMRLPDTPPNSSSDCSSVSTPGKGSYQNQFYLESVSASFPTLSRLCLSVLRGTRASFTIFPTCTSRNDTTIELASNVNLQKTLPAYPTAPVPSIAQTRHGSLYGSSPPSGNEVNTHAPLVVTDLSSVAHPTDPHLKRRKFDNPADSDWKVTEMAL